MNMKTVFKYGKIVFTFAILFFILRNVDLPELVETIRSSNYGLIILALASFAFYQILYAYNWNRILSTLKEKTKFTDLFRIHMIGLFYNLFLPTSMGGDVAKIYYLSKRLSNRMIAIKSIALLRGTGLITNLLILAFSLAFNKEILALLGFEGRAIYGVYFMAGMIVFFSLVNRTSIGNGQRVRDLKAKVQDYISRFRTFVCEFRREMYGILFISLVNQLIIIFENFLILKALGIDIGFINVMYIVPLTFFATLLPVTIAGIGIREGAFIYFLGIYNYSMEDAIAFSLIGYLLILVMGISGGIVSAAGSEKYKGSH
jgi:uncharacterized protein (TIRG00374 family)